MATHSSILVWKIPWTEEPGQSTAYGGNKESDTTERVCACTHTENKTVFTVACEILVPFFLTRNHMFIFNIPGK